MANAILDGTDAIMLSAETASGRFPLESVETMSRIAGYTEEHYGFRSPARVGGTAASMVARSLARVAATVAEELDCKLILAFTESGATARLVSSYRPRARIVAITYNEETFRRLSLWWGVVPVKSAFAKTTDEMILKGEALLKQQGMVRGGRHHRDAGRPEPHRGGDEHAAGPRDLVTLRSVAATALALATVLATILAGPAPTIAHRPRPARPLPPTRSCPVRAPCRRASRPGMGPATTASALRRARNSIRTP